MVNEKRDENLLMVLSSRRKVNARNQLRSVLLEMFEIFGRDFVGEVYSECIDIYTEFYKLTHSDTPANE